MNTVAIDTMIKTKGYKLDTMDVVYHAERKVKANYRPYSFRYGAFPGIVVVLVKDSERVTFEDKYDNLGAFADDLAAICEIIKTHFSDVKIKLRKPDYYEDDEEEEEA